MKIYAAEYTSCKYESAFEVISLHATLDGAKEALIKHEKKETHKDHKLWRVKQYKLHDI